MNRKTALKRAVYKTPLPGRSFIMWGAIIMLVWAAWECVLRVDAMDGMTKAYFTLAREGEISVGRAIQIIWETPQARKDWLNPVYLCSIALLALCSLIFHRRWTPGFAIIPLCVCAAMYTTSDVALVRALNLFETAKIASTAAVALGEGANIACALKRRANASRRLKQAQARPLPTHGTRRTLVPPRKRPRPGEQE